MDFNVAYINTLFTVSVVSVFFHPKLLVRKSELIRIKAGKALIQPSLFFHFSYFVDFVQFGKIP